VWQQTGYVFTTELGTPHEPRNALRALQAAAAQAGLPDIGLQTVRHSAAAVILVNGVPLKVVSEVLGHQHRHHRRRLRPRLPGGVTRRSEPAFGGPRMTKGVCKGVRTRPISPDRCGVGSETGF
jgi:integrase